VPHNNRSGLNHAVDCSAFQNRVAAHTATFVPTDYNMRLRCAPLTSYGPHSEFPFLRRSSAHPVLGWFVVGIEVAFGLRVYLRLGFLAHIEGPRVNP
jgi:hypothetical protein